jgi:hypothetical protein
MINCIFDLNPDSVWLDISETTKQEMWNYLSSQQFQGDQQTVYLHRLCQAIIVPYFQEQATEIKLDKEMEEFWVLGVQGFSLQVDNLRFVIVPSDTFDIDEFRIPQEWVDIPELVADYYLAAQVDMEEHSIRIWGGATHRMIKEIGKFQRRDRTYSLGRDEIIEDINVIWLRQKHFAQEPNRAIIPELPTCALDELLDAENILANPDLLFPHRAVAFATWSYILCNKTRRKRVLNRLNPEKIVKPTCLTRLSQWFEHEFEAVWQNTQELIEDQKLEGVFMSSNIKRAKQIDLKLDLDDTQIILMVTLANIEPRVSVKASLFPSKGHDILPVNLKLMILNEAGEIFKEVISRSDDDSIWYKFEAEKGDRFSAKVQLENTSVTEFFEV